MYDIAKISINIEKLLRNAYQTVNVEVLEEEKRKGNSVKQKGLSCMWRSMERPIFLMVSQRFQECGFRMERECWINGRLLWTIGLLFGGLRSPFHD